MSLAAEMRADYRDELREVGITLTVRRGTVPGTNEATALARLVGWTPEELASGLMQGARKAIVLAEDLERDGYPLPIENGDGLFIGDARLNVESVDDTTRAIGGVVIAYELGVEGS